MSTYVARIIIALTCLCSVLLSGAAVATEKVVSVEGITEYRMDNGMRVLLLPDASRATTTVNITYLVGSRHEGYGETGMAHLLEHLLFKSSENFANISEEISRRGGDGNGTTTPDRTNYYQTFPASEENLEWALSMEADRMVNALLKQSDLDSEMTVVRNEFEKNENSPAAILSQRVKAVANEWHGYGRAIVGARSDVENLPLARLQRFYRRYYQPDNAVLTVSGRFDEQKTLDQIEQQFGDLQAPERVGDMAIYPTYTRNPTQDGERRVTLRRNGNVQLLVTHFHVPAAAHPDYPAVQVLMHVLGAPPSGRLHQTLVENGEAVAAGAFSQPTPESGALQTLLAVPAGKPLEDIEQRMLEVLHGFATQPISAEEFERSRSAVLSSYEATLRSSERMGLALTEAVASGDWRLTFLNRDRLKALDLAAVNHVARKYLVPANRTLGVFIPTSEPVRAEIPEPPPISELLADYQGGKQRAAGEQFETTFSNIEQRMQRYSLDNGLKIALLPKRNRGETVRGQLVLRLGDADSLYGRLSHLEAAANMLTRGTTKRDRQALQDAFNEMSASLSVKTRKAKVEVNFETTHANLAETLALLSEALKNPSFPESEFEQLRRAKVTQYEAQQSTLPALIRNRLTRLYDGTGDPEHPAYTKSLQEARATWQNMQLADVKRAYADFFGITKGATLALVGDFDSAQIRPILASELGDWNAKTAYRHIAVPVRQIEGQHVREQVDGKANAMLLASVRLALGDEHPDYATLTFANYLLGGGFANSRLAKRLRQQDGLSYAAQSFFSASRFDERANLAAFAMYAPQNSTAVREAISEEITRLLNTSISNKELTKAREGWLREQKLKRSKDGELLELISDQLYPARTMAFQEQLESTVKTLDADQIRTTLAKHLQVDNLVVVEAGDFRHDADTQTPSE